MHPAARAMYVVVLFISVIHAGIIAHFGLDGPPSQPGGMGQRVLAIVFLICCGLIVDLVTNKD